MSNSTSLSSLDNPTTLLEINANIANDKRDFASKMIIHTTPGFSGKLVSNPFKLIQIEMDVDETMDMQPLLEERKKLGLSTCEEGDAYDCALNSLVHMGFLQLDEANYVWPTVKEKGLHPEYVRKILYHYYHKRYKGAYLPDIYILFTDVNTPKQLNTVLESLTKSLDENHYTIIGGSLNPGGGHAFLVGKEYDDELIFKDLQANTGWLSKKEFMNDLKLYKNFQFFVEQDVGMDRLKKERERARKPKPSQRKTSKTRKRKRGQTPSLGRPKGKSLPSLKKRKRKHKHDYGKFPNTPGVFHPGVRRKPNKKRKNAKKKTQKRKRKKENAKKK
jgi:hypothetical protein